MEIADKRSVRWLQEKVRNLQSENYRLSIRNIAKRSEVSAPTLSQILREKRPLTFHTAVKIANGLNLDRLERKEFLRCFSHSFEKQSKKPTTRVLSDDRFCTVANWYHFGIIGFAKLKAQSSSVKKIARFFGIEDFEARQALKRLERLGALTVQNRKLRLSCQNFETSNDIPSQAIKKFQQQVLKLATKAIREIPVEQREVQTAYIAIAQEDIAALHRDIREFVHAVHAKYDQTNADNVYSLTAISFPLGRA